jgi:galactokinase
VQLRKGLENIVNGEVLDYLLPKVEGRTGVTLDEMISMSGMDKAEFMEVYLSWVDGECLLSC